MDLQVDIAASQAAPHGSKNALKHGAEAREDRSFRAQALRLHRQAKALEEWMEDRGLWPADTAAS
jgi:hypothetical protein